MELVFQILSHTKLDTVKASFQKVGDIGDDMVVFFKVGKPWMLKSIFGTYSSALGEFLVL